MSLNLPAIALTAGAQTPINFPGDLGSIAWIKLANASAFTLTLTNLGSGQDYLQPNEVNVWPMTGVTGAVGVLASADLTGVTAGISTLFITVYLAGEDKPAGQYPYSLGLLTYVGNTVTTTTPTETPANTFNQDLFTSFVLANLLASKDPIVTNQLDVNPGIAYLSQADRGLLRITPVATTFLTSAPNATYYLDLNPDASFSFGTSHSIEQNYITIAQLTTDASGNISAVTDERPLNTILLGSLLGSIGTPQLVISTSATVNGPLEATTATLHAPPVLFTGSQETGYASGAGVAAGAANAWGFGVNFKTVMTNVPTISLNASSSSNCSAAANNITKYGFSLVLTATAAGSFFWVGSYTTVGN